MSVDSSRIRRRWMAVWEDGNDSAAMVKDTFAEGIERVDYLNNGSGGTVWHLVEVFDIDPEE